MPPVTWHSSEEDNTTVIVAILGMHRCGTSVAARMLNLLGVDLGPEERLFGARADNPRGFWEHRDFVRINNELLLRLNGNWRWLPRFPPGWEIDPELASLKERARTVIQRDFASASIWGWKDPTTSLVLPFWQQILPPMHYVICLRDPIDSARSLQRREGLSLEEGIEQWLRHIVAALHFTDSQQRLLVFFEEVTEEWPSTLRLMASFLGCPEHAGNVAVQQHTREFISPELHHFRTTEEEIDLLPIDSQIIGAVRRTYQHLKRIGDQHAPEIVVMLNDALELIRVPAEEKRRQAQEHWAKMIHKATGEMDALIPTGSIVLLVDDKELESQITCGRQTFAFLEENGCYLGPPPDDKTAIFELERMRGAGVDYIVFAWPAFWWLDHFTLFHEYLCSSFSCISRSDALIIFRL